MEPNIVEVWGSVLFVFSLLPTLAQFIHAHVIETMHVLLYS